VHALHDALKMIDALGIAQRDVFCCGDLVDYGLFPEETLAILRTSQIKCVRGNHDRWAVQPGSDASAWDLSAASMKFLRTLPTEWRVEIGTERMLVTHARPGNDMQGIDPETPSDELGAILDAARADILVVGHTHGPFVRRLGDGRIVMNPGALLRDPAPGCAVQTPGTFGEIDTLLRRCVIHETRK
jgi:predicted phosphodiesterase